MALTEALKTLYSTKIKMALKTITSLRSHCDFEYEGEVKEGARLKIIGTSDITVRKYVKGEELIVEDVQESSLFLDIDQYDYFNITIEKIDKVQAVKKFWDKTIMRAKQQLSESGDKYVASLVKVAVEDTTSPIASNGTAVQITEDNALDCILDGEVHLREQNVPASETFFIEVCPKYMKYLKKEMITKTEDKELFKYGGLGRVDGGILTLENNLAKSDDNTTIYNQVRTKEAIAFAEQIEEVEFYKPEKSFKEACKALYVYGATFVRDEQIYVIKQLVA